MKQKCKNDSNYRPKTSLSRKSEKTHHRHMQFNDLVCTDGSEYR